jgi:hypothetical protein
MSKKTSLKNSLNLTIIIIGLIAGATIGVSTYFFANQEYFSAVGSFVTGAILSPLFLIIKDIIAGVREERKQEEAKEQKDKEEK